jgi:enoyl-CoA hydratase/carnithine racemase
VAGRVIIRRDARDARIGWLVFDQPARHNAISVEMWREIPRAVRQLSLDPAVRVVILRGEGELAFVAGADISEFGAQRSGDASLRYDDDSGQAFAALAALEKPLLAMIHGHCIGGGVAIALNADVRYAAEDAVFAIPAARLGLGYQMSGLETLVRLVGPSRAKEIFFTARRFSAAEACDIGLVNAVLPAALLEKHVFETAERIANNAPLTIRSVKRIVQELAQELARRDLDAVEASIRACFESEDYREGVSAFLEKRPPRFQGR